MAKEKLPLIDRDKINNADQLTVANACVKVFDRIQAWPPHEQVLALGCAFVIFCEAARVDGRRILGNATNLMVDPANSSGRDHRFDALRHHLETEVLQ